MLAYAYLCCKANGGAAGVDQQRFEDIAAYGEERWLDELAQELKNRSYRPLPVRRAEEALAAMRVMMSKLKLTVNESKTRVCTVPEESFDFLGYTLGRCYSPTGKAYLGTIPAKKRVQRICAEVSEITAHRRTQQETKQVVGTLNRKLNGWANYFCLGPVSKAYRSIDRHTTHRLRQWLSTKHKVAGQGTKRYSNEVLYQELGLVRLGLRTANFPWAKA
jgi:hypothetical protein